MILSVGHSTLEWKEFAQLISGQVDEVWDVRSHPKSTYGCPWSTYPEVKRLVEAKGVAYLHCPNLGGWTEGFRTYAPLMRKVGVDVLAYSKGYFPKNIIQESVPARPPSWNVRGMYDYSWFMSTPQFLEAAENLLEYQCSRRIALMCCEVLWWKCHRSMIADYLLWRGVDTLHLQPKPTWHSSFTGNRLARYDTGIKKVWSIWKKSISE